MDLAVLNSPYGKRQMKKARLSPDGYLQMSMQLAYYRLHNEIVKTYEPSTGRYDLKSYLTHFGKYTYKYHILNWNRSVKKTSFVCHTHVICPHDYLMF